MQDATAEATQTRTYHDAGLADIESAFNYHAPTPDQVERYQALRSGAGLLASQIQVLCPASREKSLALTKLRESIMWANAAIACNEASAPIAAPPA